MALTLQQALQNALAERDFTNVTPQLVGVGKAELVVWAVSGRQARSKLVLGLAWPRRASAVDYPVVIETEPGDVIWKVTTNIPEWVTRWLLIHSRGITFGEELARRHLGEQVIPLD